MALSVNRSRPAPATPSPPVQAPAGEREKAAILVVDDLPEKLMVYEAVLEELGQDVVTVTSGDEALRRLLRQEFAVILLDVNMPGMDGFETAELIRRRRQSAHTPIIFITAYADEMHTAQGYSLGAVDYIPAPVVPEVLRAKVRVFVELYAMRQRVKRQAEERIALAREQIARAAAEAETRRSTFLAEASGVLASSLDFAATARGLSQLAVPFLADASALSVPEGSGPDVLTLAWRDGEDAVVASCCALPGSLLARAIARGYASGARETVTELPEEAAAAVPPPGRAAVPPLRAVAVFPLRARDRTLGVWALGLAGDRRLAGTELALAVDLSERAAVAIDNVLLLAREQAARAELAVQAQELMRLNAQLEASNRELDAFASIASHDLKEPLRGIHNFAHFLLEDHADRLDAEGAEKLRVVARLAQRMQALLDSLLHYSRVGRQELALRRVDLHDVVADTLELLQARIQETGAEIRIPRRLPAEVVDHSRVGEVFSNLVANAIKYNDKPAKRVEIGWRPAEDPAGPPVFYVRDNGIGIAEQHHDAIFRIFRRLHGREEYGGGVGVGLTIVRKIIERHGGRIWLESVPGEGTTFYFTLAPGG